MESPEVLAEIVVEATRAAAAAVRRLAWSEPHAEYRASTPPGGEASLHSAPVLDQAADSAMLEALDRSLDNYYLIGEEAPGRVLCRGRDPGDLCFIADPLDGSGFAYRRVPLACAALCAYSRLDNEPIASAVTDVFLDGKYVAAAHLDGAYLLLDGEPHRLAVSGQSLLGEASCAILAQHPARLAAFVHQARLMNGVRWFINNCGTIELCRIAAGDLDVGVEFAKGYHIWDVIAGCHILEQAGGVLRSPQGSPIRLPPDPETRQMFVAAATQELYAAAVSAVDWPG